MRDLLSLAKRAGEEAYVAGLTTITKENVATAVDAFGRALAIGLDDDAVGKLRHLRDGKGFVLRGEAEVSLVETRRVLLYPEARWAVHPTLTPLLEAMSAPPAHPA